MATMAIDLPGCISYKEPACNIECTSAGVSVPGEPKHGLDLMAFEGPKLFGDSVKLPAPPAD